MKIFISILLITNVLGKPLEGNYDRAGVCGYAGCPVTDPTALNVHVVPHSHDDVGWLKTVDQYYYGMIDFVQRAGVQYIIDSVIEALRMNPSRRYIQVETAFFWKWWEEQDDVKKQQVRDLVNSGQLEIVGGAWSMNDEAAAHYHSVVDQFTWGLKMINDSLGDCGRPRIGWQIDPFGHSREMASIFSQLGYDAVFFSRLDYRDKSLRLDTQTAEMLWLGSDNLGNNSLLFTHALYNHYSAPPGYCFDILCSDMPVIDNVNSADYNLESRVKGFGDFVKTQATKYKTNNVIMTMGDDFMYQNALKYFKNMDKLINGFTTFPQTDNSGRRMNVFYSTPSCYVKAVNDYAQNNNLAFPVKKDDFFPYASDPHAYWTGYFSSRPNSKRFERQTSNILQVAKHLTTFSGTNSATLDANIVKLRQVSGIMQHHDAITGTEKQHVSQDYAKLMVGAITEAHVNINPIISSLLDKNNTDGVIDLGLSSCLLANVSHCPQSQAQKFIVTVYNPLSRPVSHYVRLPVNSRNFTITGPNSEQVVYQVTPVIKDFSYVMDIVPSRFDLVFLATNIPPLGVKLYHVVNEAFGDIAADIEPDTSAGRFNLGDQFTNVLLDQATGKVFSMQTYSQSSMPVRPDFIYYIGAKGDNSNFENRASGAYIFRPSPSSPDAIPVASTVNLTVYKGVLIDEAHQVFNDWIKAVIRVYKGENHVEVDWIVGPIDTSDNEGREVVLRVSTPNMITGEFYTDANGRELQTRINNFRLTYNYTNEEPVSGNYYPVTSMILLKDIQKSMRVAVLTDRAQAGTSLNLMDMDLMIHRRLLNDDAFGVGEALNEDEFGQGVVVRGQHFITIGGMSVGNLMEKDISQRKQLAPWTFVADATALELDLVNLQNSINFEFAGLTRSLPNNIQILALEPWTNGTVLLRFENIYTISDNPSDTIIDLEGLFTTFDVLSIQETTLGGNQWLAQNVRLPWIAGGDLGSSQDAFNEETFNVEYTKRDSRDARVIQVILSPMEIRTFVATVTFKQ